ncbi:MAG: hypothetical protein WCQ16_06870 [Verrucomicrobiae bacterium]
MHRLSVPWAVPIEHRSAFANSAMDFAQVSIISRSAGVHVLAGRPRFRQGGGGGVVSIVGMVALRLSSGMVVDFQE